MEEQEYLGRVEDVTIYDLTRRGVEEMRPRIITDLKAMALKGKGKSLMGQVRGDGDNGVAKCTVFVEIRCVRYDETLRALLSDLNVSFEPVTFVNIQDAFDTATDKLVEGLAEASQEAIMSERLGKSVSCVCARTMFLLKNTNQIIFFMCAIFPIRHVDLRGASLLELWFPGCDDHQKQQKPVNPKLN